MLNHVMLADAPPTHADEKTKCAYKWTQSQVSSSAGDREGRTEELNQPKVQNAVRTMTTPSFRGSA